MGMASALPPANNDGVWITYEGRRYVKSGRSTRFDDTAYTQVGQLGEQPVYRRVGATPTAGTDTIYLPVVRGMLVPFSQ